MKKVMNIDTNFNIFILPQVKFPHNHAKNQKEIKPYTTDLYEKAPYHRIKSTMTSFINLL